jgi:hypothetical protein
MQAGEKVRGRRATRVVGAIAALAFVGAALAGCGTDAVANEVLVFVDRTSGAVGPGPLEAGVFDTLMGGSSEYAATFRGTTTDADPYVGRVATTVTRMIGDDRPPERLDLGVWIPAIADGGYYAVSIGPTTGTHDVVEAPFIPDFTRPSGAVPVPPLRFLVSRETVGKALKVTLVAQP